jgi:hypothetical protein
VAEAPEPELVFVVDVSSFTKDGFIGSTEYEGKTISIEFDDGDKGVWLTPEMAKRLHARKGSPISVIVEDERPELTKTVIAAVAGTARLSSAKVYYAVGKEGGAVLRLRKG